MIKRTYPRRGLHGQVVHWIGERIVRGDLQPGDSLPSDAELSAELDASRTVYREAVKVLAGKGLVESRPRTGTRVRPRSQWNLVDPDVLAWQLEAGADGTFFANLAEVRLAIEGAAVRLAAARATPHEIAALERLFTAMDGAVDDIDTYIAADLEFHSGILAACHNELLEQIGNMLRAVFRAGRVVSTSSPGAAADSMPLHLAVLDGIRDHDEDAAATAIERLIRSAAQDVDRALAAEAASDGRGA